MGREGMSRRAEKRLPERTGRYRAVDGAQVSFLLLKNIVQIFYLTRNALPPSLPSFDVVDETGQEGMLRRAKKRLPERTGKYRAVGGAAQVSFLLLKNFVQIFY